MTYLAPAGLSPPRPLLASELVWQVGAYAEAELAPLAGRIDHDGLYPGAIMRGLGTVGAFAPHLAAHTSLDAPSLGAAIAVMAAVGASCMATAFCAWCQDACGWYLENSANAGLREALQPGIASGETLGGTGLSNPVKALSGIERFKLRAQRVAGGYTVSGVLPWVSNLGDGHWFGTVFEDAAEPSHRIMAMVRCGQDGVEIKRNARFIALEGTGTYSVLFRRAFIADAMLLADPLGEIVRRIKPGFILLQTGMGMGVIQACIDLMHAANVGLSATNAYLPRQPGDFEMELASLRGEIAWLAATPLDGSPDYVRAVLTARLRTSELALEASQAALLHQGARGYIAGSAVSRRLRESYFVAIITPSIKHLRQELQVLGRH